MKTNYRLLISCAAILSLCQTVAAQQNPHGQLPVTSSDRPFLFLIRDPVVFGDLELSDQQLQAVSALNDELDRDLLSMRNKPATQVDETMTRARSTAETRLASILKPGQQRRLKQVELWTLGTRAFLSDELPTSLQLSARQTSQIRDILQETRTALDELAKQLQSGKPRESLEEQSRKLRTDEQKQIVAVLSGQQRQQWIALLGKRIDLSKLGHVRFKAPELQDTNAWINSPPLTLQQLRGKVVALHFYAFA